MKQLHLMFTFVLISILLINNQQVVADRFLPSFSPEKILKSIAKIPGFSSNGIGNGVDSHLSMDRLRKPLRKLGQAAKKALKRLLPLSEKKLRM